jgi:hypothetical protein
MYRDGFLIATGFVLGLLLTWMTMMSNYNEAVSKRAPSSSLTVNTTDKSSNSIPSTAVTAPAETRKFHLPELGIRGPVKWEWLNKVYISIPQGRMLLFQHIELYEKALTRRFHTEWNCPSEHLVLLYGCAPRYP